MRADTSDPEIGDRVERGAGRFGRGRRRLGFGFRFRSGFWRGLRFRGWLSLGLGIRLRSRFRCRGRLGNSLGGGVGNGVAR